MENRKNIFLWALYDFANSFVYISFFLYFSQWVVVDRGLPDLWFNLCFAASALLLLVTAPVIGYLLDTSWRNISGLRLTTLATIVFYSLTAWCALANQGVWALVFFAIGQYFFILSFVFYTPLLSIIAPPEKRGLVSGFGMAGNFLGNVAGLFLALPFATGRISLFNGDGHAETILPAIIAFAVFALPVLIFFREPKKSQAAALEARPLGASLKSTQELFSQKNVWLFLLAFALFSGSLTTTVNNFPILLSNVWHASDAVKTFSLLGAVVASAFGGIAAGLLADWWGEKRVLIAIIAGQILVLIAAASALGFAGFAASVAAFGFLLGGSLAVARSLMSVLVPKNYSNLGFSYFTIIERASVLAAPIIWGAVVSGLPSLGPGRYRMAMAAMILLIACSLLFLLKVRGKQPS